MTHTPEPWHLSDIDEDEVFIIDAGGEAQYIRMARKNHEQNYRDAILIAAAPEMLAALKLLASLSGAAKLYENHELRARLQLIADEARTAIAKAEGKS